MNPLDSRTERSTHINTLLTWGLFKWLSCFLNLLLHVALGWFCCLWQNAKSTSKYEKWAPLFLTSWKHWAPVNRKFILSIFVSKVENLARHADSMSYLDNCFFPVRGRGLVPLEERRGHGLVPLEERSNCPSKTRTCSLRVKWARNSVRSNNHRPWSGWLCKQGDTACNWITLHKSIISCDFN